jgi:hypothetical protein
MPEENCDACERKRLRVRRRRQRQDEKEEKSKGTNRQGALLSWKDVCEHGGRSNDVCFE